MQSALFTYTVAFGLLPMLLFMPWLSGLGLVAYVIIGIISLMAPVTTVHIAHGFGYLAIPVVMIILVWDILAWAWQLRAFHRIMFNMLVLTSLRLMVDLWILTR